MDVTVQYALAVQVRVGLDHALGQLEQRTAAYGGTEPAGIGRGLVGVRPSAPRGREKRPLVVFAQFQQAGIYPSVEAADDSRLPGEGRPLPAARRAAGLIFSAAAAPARVRAR